MFDEVGWLELGRKLAGYDMSCGSDAEVCAATVAAERLQSFASVMLAHGLCELDIRSVTDTEYGMTAASWVAREAGIPGGVARRQLRMGRCLRDLPVVDDAAADGLLSSHHVAALTDARNPRVADALEGMQDEIVALAEGARFETWRSDVRRIVELLDEDGGHDPAEDLATNRLSMAKTLDGVLALAGQLTGEHAIAFEHAIEAKADDLFRRFSADHDVCRDVEVPTRATLRALALVELVREARSVDLTSTRPPRPEATVVVLAEEPDTSPADQAGTRLQDGSTRTLLCDPDLFAVVVDSLGVPLDLGRHVRLATAAQRRAIAARDGGCVFPGCDAPIAWTDNHHIRHFEHGGTTDIANLAALCRRHHGVSHRKGWTMHATSDGWFSWQTPTGLTFWSQRHGRRRSDPPPPPNRG
jgi:hypothetical protein